MTITIPQELIDAGARFILVGEKSKEPLESDWESTNNYSADSPKLQAHISAGKNYGVLSHNGVCIADVDKPVEFGKNDVGFLKDTFIVIRGESGRGHIYFTCSDRPPEMRKKHTTPWGDIRLGGNHQTVGATCIHPSGDIYNVFRKLPLKDVHWSDVQRLLNGNKNPLTDPVGSAFNLPDVIQDGSRNDTLYKYGCSLRSLGRDADEITTLIRAANTKRCRPNPLPDDEINALLRQILQNPKGVVVTATRQFPVVVAEADAPRESPNFLEERMAAMKDMHRIYSAASAIRASTQKYEGDTRFEKIMAIQCVIYLRERDFGKGAPFSLNPINKRCIPPLTEEEINTTRDEAVAIVDLIVDRHNTAATGLVKPAFNPYKYAEELKGIFHFVYFNKIIYIYDEETHVYRKQTNEIETHARNHLHDEWSMDDDLSPQLTEIRAHVTSMGSCAEFPFNKSKTDIPVLNGIVRINYNTEEITLLPPGHEHLFTYKLNVAYDPTINGKMAMDLLKRIVERPHLRTLLQIPAQSLLQMQTGNAFKKAYLLIGEPHAGKTSFLKLLYGIFVSDYTASASLKQLCDDHFIGGILEGKLLNIFDDLEDVPLKTIDQFKALTGDCRYGIERKFEGQYTGSVTAVHCFTANYPPEYPPKVRRDAAFWERWEIIKFPFSYPVNPNFYDEWYTPDRYSSFFNLILSTMIEIKKRGLLTKSESNEVMMAWSTNSDPLYEYIHSMFDPYDGITPLRMHRVKLHDHYLQWCKETNIPEHKWLTTLRSFTTALQAYDIVSDRVRIGKKDDDRIYVYQTLSYIRKSEMLVVDLNPITLTELTKSREPTIPEPTSGVYASGQGTLTQ